MQEKPSSITVLLADDHAVVAEGLAALLSASFTLVGWAHNGRDLVSMSEELRPDVIVTDVSMPQLNGLDAIRQIRTKRADAKIVVLTMHSDTDLAVQAFRAGASAYVLKTSPGEELLTAIRTVAQGRVFLTSLIAKDIIEVLLEANQEPKTAGARLTPRQREVLQLIAEGRTMKEVASVLGISPRTAETHKYEMMQLLGATTTASLIQHAIRLKLIPDLKD